MSGGAQVQPGGFNGGLFGGGAGGAQARPSYQPYGGQPQQYGSPYANSGLARFGQLPMWQPSAYQPRTYQPPQLGPRPHWMTQPGTAGGAPPVPIINDGGGPGPGSAGGPGSSAGGPSNTQGQATPGVPGGLVGSIAAAALGLPPALGFALGNQVGSIGGAPADGSNAAAAAQGASNADNGVNGSGVSVGGQAQGEANDAEGNNADGGGGAGGK